MTTGKTIYRGPFVHCVSLAELDICVDGSIGVDEDGKIAFILRDVGDGPACPSDGKWEQATTIRVKDEGFFFPGFIDTHIHASQYPNAGIFGKSTLLDWLHTYTFPLESSFSDLAVARRIYPRVVSRTLSHGTTTACYYATTHVPATNLLADICHARGQRAFIGRVCMDHPATTADYYRDTEDEATTLALSRACVAHVKSIDPSFALISPILTPRFAPSCSTESMRALAKFSHEANIPIQTHISENVLECELVKELFPDHQSYTNVYDSVGLLTNRTILAHAIHLDDSERALIRERGTKISHCPASNTALTSGTAKVRTLLDEGLTVGLGTDVSGGYTPSVLAEAREAIFVSRHVAMTEGERAKLSVAEALYLATRGGAKVCGLGSKIGGFEVGMSWDAQLVGLKKVPDKAAEGNDEIDDDAGLVDVFGKENWEDKIAKWLYTGDDRNTLAVWVQGRLVHSRKSFQP